VMFSVCPQALIAAATTMAGPQSDLRFAPLQRPLELLESHPQQGNLLALLRRSLRLIDLVQANSPSLPETLGLDDKILRLIALLIYPQLLRSDRSGRPAFGPREASSFADLLTAIQADPLGEWTLTRMERQAALSHFQLRRHFQASFDCGPLEWLRLQRLCWARQRLNAAERIPLARLALQCGYADLAAFRTAFEHRFQIPLTASAQALEDSAAE
jgi:AraC-like DNA-binding protein